jgi:hypothetical protein
MELPGGFRFSAPAGAYASTVVGAALLLAMFVVVIAILPQTRDWVVRFLGYWLGYLVIGCAFVGMVCMWEYGAVRRGTRTQTILLDFVREHPMVLLFFVGTLAGAASASWMFFSE